MDNVKNLIEEQARLWEEAKEANEKNISENRRFKGEFDEKWSKLNNRIEDIESEIKDNSKKLDLVKSNARPVADTKEAEKSEYSSLFFKYLQQGHNQMVESDKIQLRKSYEMLVKADVRSLTDAAGGYAVPENLHDEILVNAREFSPIRNFARVITLTQGHSLKINSATQASAGWDAEGVFPATEYDPTFSQVEYTPYQLNGYVQVSREALQDIPNIQSFVLGELGEAITKKEGEAFAIGDGTTSYGNITGLANISGLTVTTAASATAVTVDELFDCVSNLKTPYHANARFTFNRDTLFKIKQLKTADNQYLWQPNVNALGESTLIGYGYFLSNDLVDMATGTKSIFFSDFSKGFVVVDRTGLSITRLNEKNFPFVDFVMSKRVGGGSWKKEAITGITMG